MAWIVTGDNTYIRTARKAHACSGGYDRENCKRTRCEQSVIPAGTTYVEYLGESPLYASGKRYHTTCAEQQGLIRWEVQP